MNPDFTTVTELAGDQVSQEQVDRLCQKYYWAGSYCRDRDVVEIGCGTGPGLGYLATVAKSVVAGDISDEILSIARKHYGTRIPLERVDAQKLPYADASKDVLMLFEAIYYLSSPASFVLECRRVLRPGGVVLIVSANKDLPGFNPSPYSQRSYGIVELEALFDQGGFTTEFFGNCPMAKASLRQKVLQPVKQAVVGLGLMPKTMAGKKLLKRLVFGKLVPMPAEITASTGAKETPTPLATGVPNTDYKVLFCVARRRAYA